MPRTMPRAAGVAVGMVGILFAAATDVTSQRSLAQAQAQAKTKEAAKAAEPDGAPILQSLFPPGATVGTSVEWKFTGTRLDTIRRWLISGTGVEINEMKAADAGTLTASVSVAADAEPGYRELRAVSSEGVSNLLLFRVDSLPQILESEPNDDPSKANVVPRGSSVAGILKPQDVDYYRVEGEMGGRIVVDLEAQRLGTPIAPVVTILTANGGALAQAREHPGVNHDCRMGFVFPATGSYVIQVHDNSFNGGDTAAYRLRIDEAPFATGMFPLGGPAGKTITVTASGGDLANPRSKTLTLPDTPGQTIDAGLFDGPGGALLAPARLLIGDGPEVNESAPGSDGVSTTALALGTTANGRLDKAGEVDRYTIKVKKGEPLHIRIQAAPLGSWLDSVVTLKDDKGKILAENDDPVGNRPARQGVQFGLPESPPDSRLDFTPTADGELTLEVADRYGDGGPEYAYRLDACAAKPDFSITLLITNPNINQGRIIQQAKAAAIATPGSTGAFNLKPGATIPVNFLITPEGFSGTIEVTAEGLPRGVTATKLTVTNFAKTKNNQPSGGVISLRADNNADPVLGDMRIVATGRTTPVPAALPLMNRSRLYLHGWPMLLVDAASPKLEDPRFGYDKGQEVTRTATALISFNPLPMTTPSPFGTRPITRLVTSLPVAVTGGPRSGTRKPAGPSKPIVVTVKDIPTPGPLLQGGQLELALEIDAPAPASDSFSLEAGVKGRGLLTQTFISSYDGEEESQTPAQVRVQASATAELGPKTLRITIVPKLGQPIVREVPIEVRAPIAVSVPKDPILLDPGGTTTFRVEVKREEGYASAVGVKLESLPKGVTAGGDLKIASDQTGLDVTLEMDRDAARLVQPVAFRVVGVAGMTRGPVRVDSANRPMVMSRSAEK